MCFTGGYLSQLKPCGGVALTESSRESMMIDVLAGGMEVKRPLREFGSAGEDYRISFLKDQMNQENQGHIVYPIIFLIWHMDHSPFKGDSVLKVALLS